MISINNEALPDFTKARKQSAGKSIVILQQDTTSTDFRRGDGRSLRLGIKRAWLSRSSS